MEPLLKLKFGNSGCCPGTISTELHPSKRLLDFNEKVFRVWRPGRHREVFKGSKGRSMRSPWVGSLALLAPAHGFVSQPMISRSNMLMLQAFAMPMSTSAFRAAATRGWSQRTVKLRRIAPHGGVARTASGPAGGGSGGSGDQAKKNKPKKPESYYKNTVILPQTDFQQVRYQASNCWRTYSIAPDFVSAS